MTTGLARTRGLTGAEFPADTRILDFGNPIPSDTPRVTTGLAGTRGLTGAEFPADTRILGFGNPIPSDTPHHVMVSNFFMHFDGNTHFCNGHWDLCDGQIIVPQISQTKKQKCSFHAFRIFDVTI